MRTVKTCHLESPFGVLRLTESEKGLAELHILRPDERPREKETLSPLLEEACRQLMAYCGGRLRVFDLPLDLNGTDFQRAVWAELCNIPYGETASYGEIACLIGRPRAVRAVGGANHRNPVAIIVPCHRVIGSDGRLVGYGGGVDLKAKLLSHERTHARRNA
jgi:methylated-DNA-[protein]-cysteine S-methyltransferase